MRVRGESAPRDIAHRLAFVSHGNDERPEVMHRPDEDRAEEHPQERRHIVIPVLELDGGRFVRGIELEDFPREPAPVGAVGNDVEQSWIGGFELSEKKFI